MNDVAIILPSLNEEQAIGSVIREIRTLPIDCDIILADNASTDKTVAIADSLGALIVNVPERGKGNAIREAINYLQSEFAFMFDSDGTYPAVYIIDMLILLKQGYDAVVGRRSTKNMNLYNRICNVALSVPNYTFYGGRNPDICSGFWGFHTQVLKDLSLSATDFTLEADITASVCSKKLKLASIQVEYRRRMGGESKIKFRDGFRICGTLFKRALN